MKHLFISAELSTLSQSENKARTRSLGDILTGLEVSGFRVVPVNGCYMGATESSYRVTRPEGELFNIAFLRGLARNLGQHSVLWVKSDGTSFLDYMECGTFQHLGQMVKVTETDGLAAWSEVQGEGFYAIK